jgi:hypothetical protein
MISANVRRFSLNVLASACDAALRIAALGLPHEIERRLDGERFRADLEAQAGDGLVEQAIPGRISCHRFFVEELLDAILELIWLLPTNIFEPRAVVCQRAILHGSFELGVVEPVELEREEQEMRGRGGDALLHVGVELRARGIDGVAGVEEPAIGHKPPEKIIERLIALHRLGERRAGVGSFGERCELALVGLLEGQAFGGAVIEIALHLRIIEPGIEIGEIPFRQRAEAVCGPRLGGSTSGGVFCWDGHNRLRKSDDFETSSVRNTRGPGAWMMDIVRSPSSMPMRCRAAAHHAAAAPPSVAKNFRRRM